MANRPQRYWLLLHAFSLIEGREFVVGD